MDKQKLTKVIKNVCLISLLVFSTAIFMFVVFQEDLMKTGNFKEQSYEAKEYSSFIKATRNDISKVNTDNKSEDDLRNEYMDIVVRNQKKHSSGEGVDTVSFSLMNAINDTQFKKPTSIFDSLNSILSKPKPLFPHTGRMEKFSLTMPSKTVCATTHIDSKYCVDSLSAKVYVKNKNSNKWAVLVHGVMMNGKQMYNAVGDMYSNKGYNVVAVDLRGFGDSNGKVAMGYLESLDVYDWIKDLNENWRARYKVNVAPAQIIVHGVSLGAATTLQLATNPDIAAKQGEPYTKNLTDLKVKGFIDDCGYTSMSGIITGMLTGGKSSNSSSTLSMFDIDKLSFMKKIEETAKELNIPNLSGSGNGNIISKDQFNKFFGEFSNKFNKVIGEITNNNNIINPNNGEHGFDIHDYIPNKHDSIIDIIKPTSNEINNNSLNNNYVMMGNSLGSNLIDKLVAKVIMDLVGVGLTDQNYDKYSNIFSEGRRFPEGSKFMIIHGTKDTTVPHANADQIASHIANYKDSKLLYKWDLKGAPHAFIIVGSHKKEYTNLIDNYTSCVYDNKCDAFNQGGDAPLK